MKSLRMYALLTLCVLLLGATSCSVVPKQNNKHHDNGKHLGWYKNSNNPHNYKSTKQNNVKHNKSSEKSKKHR